MSRWARRIGLALLALVAALTLAAFAFDLATNGDTRPGTSLYAGPFVRVDGTLLAYRSWGGRGSPLVLLGGAAEPSWVWHEVGPLLAGAGHRVYALDLPPFGYSQRGGPYTMTRWLQLLDGFERRLHIVDPVLVGHSLGAGVAAAAGLAHPRSVAGVVLLDGDALAFGRSRGWLASLFVYPYYTALYRIVTGSDWIVGRILRNAWGPNPPHVGHATLAQFERPFRVLGTATAMTQLFGGGIPGLTLAALARLGVPRAVLWGAADHVDSLSSGHATAAALHTRLELIPQAGHLSMLARPRATAERILRFVAAGTAAPDPPYRVRTFRFVDRTRSIELPNGTSEARPLTTVVRIPSTAGRHPLIVFAHGYALTPGTYAHLLDAWARAGYAVAAPIFPLTNAHAPGGPNEADLIDQPRDVSVVISRLLALSRRPGGPLAGRIDPARIAVAGHSDGGVTALAAAYDGRFRDRRIRAAVVMSGAQMGGMGAFPSRGPPLLAVQGTADTINPPAATQSYFGLAPRPKFLLWLLGAEHLPPYTTERPQLAVVERATLAFLGHYLLGRPLAAFIAAAKQPGATRFVAHP